MKLTQGDLIGKTITIAIAVALVPIIYQFVEDANMSGAVGTLLSLVPLAFVAIVLYTTTKTKV